MLEKRIRNKNLLKKVVAPEVAAGAVKDGMNIGTAGGILPSGPRMFFKALAERARKGEIKEVNIWSVALLSNEIDGLLAETGVLKRRFGSIWDNTIRKGINTGKIYSNDLRVEMFSHYLRSKTIGKLDVSVIEAVGITEEGHIIPPAGLVELPNQVEAADIVIVEINNTIPVEMEGICDVYVAKNPPHQEIIPLRKLSDRIGTPYIPAGEDKITYIVESDLPEMHPPVLPISEESKVMADLLLSFLREEVKQGKMPPNLLPLACGIGNVSDAVMKLLAKSEFENLEVFSPLIGDGVFELIDAGKCNIATAPGILVSNEVWKRFCDNIEEYKKKVIVRSVDVSHDPGIIKRLGCIVLNNALEVDIYGHVNSTHIGGKLLVNGVGGGGVYAANGYLSIFLTNSTGKGGNVSSVVPMVAHVDHTEHSVDVIITEQGLADVRGLSPVERAGKIIANCAHPDYRPLLTDYLERAGKLGGHEPHILDEAFSFYTRLKKTGSMKES
ncbi:MAG: acetyl-CoA hydrolase [Peptococcaceae bacterium]|jgi:succinyl-CoA:acetate CoA-transferase|nr:MAG: acetyl-CoA hydrolase [Peptococcaceae bacterium]